MNSNFQPYKFILLPIVIIDHYIVLIKVIKLTTVDQNLLKEKIISLDI